MPPHSPPGDSLYRSIVEAIPDALLVVDVEGMIVFANGRAEELLGYGRGEIVNQPVELLLPQRLQDPHQAARANFLREPRHRAQGGVPPLVARRKNGTEIPVDVGLSPVSTAKGHFTIASMRDVSSRLATKRALREANERARVIIDEAPLSMAIVGLDGRLLRINRAFCELLGYSEAELLSRTFQDITHPDDLNLDLELAGKLARGEIPRYRLEKRYLRKDSSVVRVLLWASVVRDEAEAPLCFIAQVEDVTERWRASEALRLSEMRYRAIIEQAPVGVFVADLDGRFVEANDAGCQMLGYQGKELLGMTIMDLIRPEDIPRLMASRQRMMTPGSTDTGEWQVRHKESHWVPAEVSAAILPDGRWQAFVHDISARKRAEQEREAVMQELRAVLEECPVGITIIRDGGRTLEPNAKARQMYGAPFSLYELLRFIDRIRSPEGMPLPYDELPAVQALRGLRVEPRELWLETADGRRLPIEVNATPVFSPDGRISSAVEVWRDLTQQKKLERLRSEWNAIIAHDLRQPINNINIFALLLARQPLEWTPRARLALSQITSMTRRLSRMTFDLLDLSRLDAGKLSLQRAPLDLGSLASECVSRALLEAPDRNIELSIHDDDLPPVDGDPDRLAQVLENVLSNALKYSTPGTPIDIDVARVGDDITVSVTNQGGGIAPADLGLIFERFGRAEGGKRSVGLGLSIALGLVKAHGGRIGVESKPGEKTTFWFTLPVSAPKP